MKLITLECPKCNAQLDINSTLTYATCNCCGCHFLVEDEARNMNLDNARQMGYEFERGKIEQRIDEGYYCAKKIKELIKPISELNKLIGDSNNLYVQIQNLRVREDALFSVYARVKPFIVPCCIIAMVIVISMFYNIPIYIWGMGVVVAGLWWGISVFLANTERTKLTEQIEQKINQYDDINSRIKSIYQEYDIDFIPQEYRLEDIMEDLYNVLINKRAMNIQQAINIYEDEQHKKRMEEFQKEQIAIQRQQLYAMKKDDEYINNQRRTGSAAKTLLTVGGIVLATVALIKHLDDE